MACVRYPRSMVKGKQLKKHEEKKKYLDIKEQRAIIIMHDAGITNVRIAKKLEIHRNTVTNTLARWKEGVTLEDRPRSGRPMIMDWVGRIVLTRYMGDHHASNEQVVGHLQEKGYGILFTTL